VSIPYRAVREEPGRILPFLEALCSFSPADGTWATEESSSCGTPVAVARTGAGVVVAMVPVMLSIGTTEGSSSGGTAGARTGAGGIVPIVAMVPVMLGTGATEGSSGGGAAGAGARGVVAVTGTETTEGSFSGGADEAKIGGDWGSAEWG
jgi:hypothetical protein